MYKTLFEGSAAGVTIAALLLAITLSAAASAEETTHDVNGGEHGWHKHYLAGFIGGYDEGREEGAALAIEYERRLNERFGIGGVLEYAFGDADAWLGFIPFAYHSGPWRLYAAPGVEEDVEHGTHGLLRLGVEYGFHVGDWEISPQFDVDFIDGEEIFVLGIAIGQGF